VYSEPEFERALRGAPRSIELLAAFVPELGAMGSFEAGPVEVAFRSFIEARGAKPPDLVHALRVAVTGKGVGFGLFEAMAILGKDRCLARIHRALERVRLATPGGMAPTRSEG
jgi:glutamyl-tRNA synthetase